MFCLLQAGIGSDQEVTQDSTQDLLEGGGRFGVYEIDCHADGGFCELGRGAMGVTYRATDTSLQRKVALKIIKTDIAERSADARERFVREARAAAAFRHEHIATVYQFGMRLETGQYFYAMELIEGETLDDRVHRTGPLDARTTIGIGDQVTSALAAAQKQGLVHRDLKPANLMLVNADDPEVMGSDQSGSKRSRMRALRKSGIPVVKIIDFGLAKAFHSATDPKSLTHDRFVGTPRFASPEQFEHAALDVRSDIYSLGDNALVCTYRQNAIYRPYSVGDPPRSKIKCASHRTTQSGACPASPEIAAWVDARIRTGLATRHRRVGSAPETLHSGSTQRATHARRSGSRNGPRCRHVYAFLFHSRVENSALNPAPEKSIAVLPFENRSEDKANAYIADSIQDEILTRLSKIADLKVISRTSTREYQTKPANVREIAKQLGVAHILEGSVQKSGDSVRVNVQLINAATDFHVWADTFDRKVTDILWVESEVARSIAEQLRATLTGQEEQLIAAKPTDNPEAYDAYLRGFAYTLKTDDTAAQYLGAQRYLKEAVRLDPKFALAWALLSRTDAAGYRKRVLQPTDALREEARQAAETALSLQPNLGEALMAKGFYHYACLKDYDTATRYLEEARHLLPNNSQVPESLAYVTRRRGQWDRSEAYFNEAERLNARDANLLIERANSYIYLRRFPEALRKLDEVLNITPDDFGILAMKAAIAQAEGDLPRAAALLTTSQSNTDDSSSLLTRVYQAILERNPAQIIPRIKQELAKADPASGFHTGDLRFWLGWTQELAGDHAAAQESWRLARSELDAFLKEQPENVFIIVHLALTDMGLGDKAAAFALVERAMAAMPMEKDVLDGALLIETLAQVAARMGEPDRAIAALRKAISIPSPNQPPFTPAVLRLDPMFDPLRGDPRFQELCKEKQP